MLYLHKDSLSPDPTYGRNVSKIPGNQLEEIIYPNELNQVLPASDAVARWNKQLGTFKKPPVLKLKPGADSSVSLTMDFGTELEAFLEVDVTTKGPVFVIAWFGESLAEAQGHVFAQYPDPRSARYFPKAGRHQLRFDPAAFSFLHRYQADVPSGGEKTRGFRFVRLIFIDVRKELVLHNISARAQFTFQKRDGDFQCSDARFQRVWQSSLYTARLCTKPHEFWDGVKRDRHGWFGDARITKLAVDQVFFDPRPSETMLAALPTGEWANTIPNYSFDAIAMLKQHILYYGLERPCIKECYRRIKALLAWAKQTQVDRNGFIIRTDRMYYSDIGFVDHSPMPVGGRFEELSWLQCKYLEGLRNAQDLAVMLRDLETANDLQKDIERLAKRITKLFWRAGAGFVHTLNHVGIPYSSGYLTHYQKTYVEKIRLGPSESSRQSNASAVAAGVATSEMKAVILREVFNNKAIGAVKTPYFSFYEQSARAECGDRRGAIMQMRGYIGSLLENEDAPTVWEYYDPEVRDLRKYSLGPDPAWPYSTSFCHGWGAGAVPLAARYLLGINPTSPGYRTVNLEPIRELPWTFTATVPTPEGPIKVVRDDPDGKIRYTIPKGIQVTEQK